jgi:YVTN family beta-propeller protein
MPSPILSHRSRRRLLGLAATVTVSAAGLALAAPAHALTFGLQAFVSNGNDGSVSVINPFTGSVTATIGTGTNSNPMAVVANPAGTAVYVLNYGFPGRGLPGTTISVINPFTDTVTGTISGVTDPYAMAVSPTQPLAYAVGHGTVWIINTRTGTVTGTISGFSNPSSVAISPDGRTAYISDYANNDVSVISTSTSTSTVTATIAVGANPYGLAISPSGSEVYVANRSSNTVSVINTSTGTVTATIGVGDGPSKVAFNPIAGTAYVVNTGAGTVSVINTSTSTVIATITSGLNGADAVGVGLFGLFAYITNYQGDDVAVLNPRTNTVTSTIPVGNQPAGVAFAR